MTLIERARLIDNLKRKLPYPSKWYQSLPDEKLLAIYLQHQQDPITKPEHQQDPITKPVKESDDIGTTDPYRRINEDTGEYEVLTDAGVWEIMYD